MKILVTGFTPFGGDKFNPSYEAVKLLPSKIAGADIVTVEVPTIYVKVGDALKKAVDAHKPDVVVCVGQAGGRPDMTIEKIAVNLMGARIPDNEGTLLSGVPIKEDGPAGYFSSLPVNAIVKKIKEGGIPASISYTAGTFICNNIMYLLLDMIANGYKNMRGGFIHIPFDIAQAAARDGATSMPIPTVAKALEYAIEAIVENPKDIAGIAGTTH